MTASPALAAIGRRLAAARREAGRQCAAALSEAAAAFAAAYGDFLRLAEAAAALDVLAGWAVATHPSQAPPGRC